MPRTVLAVAHRIRRRARRGLRSAAGQGYRYDAQGRRVRSEVGGAQRRYSLYAQDGRLLWQRDEVAATRSVNVYLAGSLVAEYSRPLSGANASVGFLHTDPLGSPIAKTDATGAVVETSEYEPYGLLLNRANDDRAGYTGHVQDSATGLTYMQQRYYDPSIGRFLSVDPVAAREGGDNFNRYAYAFNNPYKFNDPDGRDGANFYSNPQEFYRQGAAADPEALKTVVSVLPVLGDISSVVDAIREPTLLNISVAAIGAIPEVGPLAGKALKEGVAAEKLAGKAVADANRAENLAKGIPASQLGPSGKPMIHVVDHGGQRGAAKEAARREVGRGGSTVNHTSPKVGGDHYHGVTQSGEKSRVHHEYDK